MTEIAATRGPLPVDLSAGVRIRHARLDEARTLAGILIDVVHWGRLRDLGLGFNTLMHRCFIRSKYGVCLALEDSQGRIMGYGAALSDTRLFHREMILRYGLPMALVLAPRLLRKKDRETILRAFTYFPAAPEDDPKAEFVCMNVVQEFQGGGCGRWLFNGLMNELKARGVRSVKLGHVDATKKGPNAYWQSMGARLLRTEKFYQHNEVNVYVYDIP